MLVVHPGVSLRTVPELIAYAKESPGKINVASGGNGSIQHIYLELLKMLTGANLVHVPYRGGGPALTDLLGGHAQAMFDTATTCIEHIRAARLCPLAVTTATRLEVLPDVPSMSEFVPGFEGSGWQGIGAPKNTPTDIIDKLNREISAGLSDSKIKTRFTEWASLPFVLSPDDFGKHIADETEKWAKVIRTANIKPD